MLAGVLVTYKINMEHPIQQDELLLGVKHLKPVQPVQYSQQLNLPRIKFSF
jgi:hypothetical protein